MAKSKRDPAPLIIHRIRRCQQCVTDTAGMSKHHIAYCLVSRTLNSAVSGSNSTEMRFVEVITVQQLTRCADGDGEFPFLTLLVQTNFLTLISLKY